MKNVYTRYQYMMINVKSMLIVCKIKVCGKSHCTRRAVFPTNLCFTCVTECGCHRTSNIISTAKYIMLLQHNIFEKTNYIPSVYESLKSSQISEKPTIIYGSVLVLFGSQVLVTTMFFSASTRCLPNTV